MTRKSTLPAKPAPVPAPTSAPAAPSRSLAARHDGFTPERQRHFLALLAEHASVARAALLAGVSRNTVYRLRNDPDAHDFRAAWEEALARAIDALTDLAFERAVEGVEEPVYYRGEQVGVRHRTSDRMLMFLLSRAQMFQPRMVAQDRRTVVAVHDEATFAAALDRIAPEPPPEPPVPAERPVPWRLPPLGYDPDEEAEILRGYEEKLIDSLMIEAMAGRRKRP